QPPTAHLSLYFPTTAAPPRAPSPLSLHDALPIYLDVIIAAEDPGPLLDALPALEAIDSAARTGERGARGMTHTGMAVIPRAGHPDRKSTRLNSSHDQISYAVFCSKKKITLSQSRR